MVVEQRRHETWFSCTMECMEKRCNALLYSSACKVLPLRSTKDYWNFHFINDLIQSGNYFITESMGEYVDRVIQILLDISRGSAALKRKTKQNTPHKKLETKLFWTSQIIVFWISSLNKSSSSFRGKYHESIIQLISTWRCYDTPNIYFELRFFVSHLSKCHLTNAEKWDLNGWKTAHDSMVKCIRKSRKANWLRSLCKSII